MIKTYSCYVANRGKGAKGTRAIVTFGKPVKAKDAKANDPVTDWDYSALANLDEKETKELEEKVSAIAHRNILLGMAADLFARSKDLAINAQATSLQKDIFNAGLASDLDTARNVALLFGKIQADNKANGMPIPSIESLMEGRKKIVENLKSQGLWVAAKETKETDSVSKDMAPRLNKDAGKTTEETAS